MLMTTAAVLFLLDAGGCATATLQSGKKDGLVFVQAEDEIGASFMLLGAVMAGQKAFRLSRCWL